MFLPPSERRGEIHFYVAKSLPYGLRMLIAFSLMLAGLSLQLAPAYLPAFASLPNRGIFLPIGLAFVAFGVLMLLTKGYENKVTIRSKGEKWRPVGRADVERILEVNRKQRSWDNDAIDITSPLGCLAAIGIFLALGAAAFLVVTVGAVFPGGGILSPPARSHSHPSELILNEVVSFVMPRSGSAKPGVGFLVVNAAIMLAPFWITGVRRFLKNDRLVLKAQMLVAIEEQFKQAAPAEGEEFQYQLLTDTALDGKSEVPRDVKAMVHFKKASPDFLGLQMQININSVQGSDYPYFYCVLVAKESFEGFRNKLVDSSPREIVVENKSQNDVNVIVIRQRTTRNSGYHTKPKDAARIFAFALTQARRLTA